MISDMMDSMRLQRDRTDGNERVSVVVSRLARESGMSEEVVRFRVLRALSPEVLSGDAASICIEDTLGLNEATGNRVIEMYTLLTPRGISRTRSAIGLAESRTWKRSSPGRQSHVRELLDEMPEQNPLMEPEDRGSPSSKKLIIALSITSSTFLLTTVILGILLLRSIG